MVTEKRIGLIGTCVVLCAVLMYPVLALSETVISDGEAGNYVGKSVTVKGTLANVYTSAKGNTFLNFGRSYPNQTFTAVVFSSNASRFKDLHQYEGKTVMVKGKIKMYKGKPEMLLADPAQLSVAK